MRRVCFGDVIAAARALRATDVIGRDHVAQQMFREAELADRYTRKLGKQHPDWGTGTLRDVAMRRDQSSVPNLDDPEFCACMITILDRCRLRPRNANL